MQATVAALTDTLPGRTLTDSSHLSREHAGMTHSQGHKALRKGRGSERGRIYHVTFATVNRTPWFHDPATAMAACRTFAPSIAAADAEWMCWVLMPDHFHGLLRLHGSQDLSRCVQRLKGRATVACHAALGRQAAIWARGFHDHAMRRDEDVWAAARYIVANPERAGLVADAMQYPYWNAEWL